MCSYKSTLTMGPGWVLAVSVICAMSVFLVAHSAPTSLKSAEEIVRTKSTSESELTHEKPLIRTKRAEEILYGNHQNAARVKKSDPSIAAPAEGQVNGKTGGGGGDSTKTDANALPPEVSRSHVDEEKQDEEQEEADEAGAANEQNNLEDIPIEADEADYPRYYGTSDEEGPGQPEATRKKRSTKKRAALMTAENMVASGNNIASVANRPVRNKRDLDYEELRELLENSRQTPYEVEEEEEEEEMARPVGAVFPVLPETGNEGEEEEEEEVGEEEVVPVVIPYAYGPRDDASREKEELIRELVEKKAEEDAKEKLIDYLLAAAIASEAESADDEGDGRAEEVDEGEDDDGRFVAEASPGRPDYDEDGDDDRAGIGPMVAKRNVFYPYSYEPYGGRWGAMVPGAKRSADEYERLYRLAEALNADDDDYEEK